MAPPASGDPLNPEPTTTNQATHDAQLQERSMDQDQGVQARELHRTLDFIGLRAQATMVGLIQLCAELVKVSALDDDAIGRIKDAIHREITVSNTRGYNRPEFDDTLRQRLDAIFPQPGNAGARDKVGTLEEMETALDPKADDRPMI
jgi:hypothetical protein